MTGMKLTILFLIIAIIMPIAFADKLLVSYDLTRSDIVSEDITAEFDSGRNYSTFSFETIRLPISVQYAGEYRIIGTGDGYIIEFKKEIVQGPNSISFTLLYDDIIERSGNRKIFRNSISTGLGEMEVSLRLPAGYTLSGSPGAIPKPKETTTDGERITLYWSFTDRADISVFYGGGWNPIKAVAFAGLFLILFTVLIIYIAKRHIKKAVTDTLSEDQKKVVDLISIGKDKQQDIAKELGFSKSKMSKVLRGLEEKGLVEKEAYFKTNKIKLKGI